MRTPIVIASALPRSTKRNVDMFATEAMPVLQDSHIEQPEGYSSLPNSAYAGSAWTYRSILGGYR